MPRRGIERFAHRIRSGPMPVRAGNGTCRARVACKARFQTMLHGGERLLADLASEPLAKSVMPPSDPVRWRAARQRSYLPAGARHEAWSSALVQDCLHTPGIDYPGDHALLLHLIATPSGKQSMRTILENHSSSSARTPTPCARHS